MTTLSDYYLWECYHSANIKQYPKTLMDEETEDKINELMGEIKK